jgi:hypothetical protein
MHPPEIAAMVRPVLPLGLALLLAACTEPNAPDKEQPPEPQAAISPRGGDATIGGRTPSGGARGARSVASGAADAAP